MLHYFKIWTNSNRPKQKVSLNKSGKEGSAKKINFVIKVIREAQDLLKEDKSFSRW
jgi:hypothetical protein